MKKTISSLLIIFVIITSAYSKNGYKDFKWGMTPEQVKKLIQSTGQEDKTDQSFDQVDESDQEGYAFFKGPVMSVMYSLYTNELEGENLPELNSDAIKSLYARNENVADIMKFLFSNNKLVGVSINFFRYENTIRELENRYGKGVSLKVDDPLNSRYFFEYRVWLVAKRYVVWSWASGRSNNIVHVTFLDEEWSKQICKKSIQNYRKEKQQEKERIKSRLD